MIAIRILVYTMLLIMVMWLVISLYGVADMIYREAGLPRTFWSLVNNILSTYMPWIIAGLLVLYIAVTLYTGKKGESS